MAKSQDQAATFMMLCLRDFSSKLWIPTKFVKKYSEISEQKSVMLQTDSKKCWDVKIKRMDGDLYMTEGWSDFVKDNELVAFDFLTFRLLDPPSFEVSVYGTHGCLKRPTTTSSSSDDEILHEIKARDEDVSKKELGRPPKFVLHGKNLSTNRRRSKARNDVVSVDSSNNNLLYLEICLRHHQRSRLSLPIKFWRACGLMERKHVNMEFVTSGYCIRIALEHVLSRIDLTRGWSEFRKANRIAIGETFSFEYNLGHNVIRVKRLKKQWS